MPFSRDSRFLLFSHFPLFISSPSSHTLFPPTFIHTTKPNEVPFVRVSKHLESLYGSEWREKVSPPSSSARTGSSASQTAVSSSLSHPTPVQAASGTLQSSDSSSAAATQPSPTEAVNGSTSSPTHPSPEASSSTSESQGAAGESTVDPAVRFSQCKEKGNSLVKQVSITETMRS